MKQAFLFWPSVALVLLWAALPRWADAQALRGTFATGSNFSLSIHADGTLWATGANGSGQLGLGTPGDQTTWVRVGTDTDWVQVAAGDLHALGLRSNGTLYAWGSNASGQLGDGTLTDRNSPGAVSSGGPYVQVAAGAQHSLGLRADGTIYAWGSNASGQLGDGTLTDHGSPAVVGGSGIYTQAVAGADFSLGLRSNGTLYTWGNNASGQLGDGTTTSHGSPAVINGGPWVQAAAGAQHALAVAADGQAYAWGDNASGQLGDGTTTSHGTPAVVGGGGIYTQLAAGSQHSLGLRADGTAYAWGDNAARQLGDGSSAATRPAPVAVTDAGPWTQLAAAGKHSLALRANGQLAGWGDNTSGQLGTGSLAAAVPAPTVTGSALPTRSIAMGGDFALAVKADGTLWAWGNNTYGQLGQAPGALARSYRSVQVGTDSDWLMVAAGTSSVLGLKADGRLFAWGVNTYGQLGTSTNLGTSNANYVPTLVGGGYKRIAAGFMHSLGVQADGRLLAWGYNYYGQLANPDPASQGSTPNPTPRQVGTGYVAATAGTFFSLGLQASGAALAWGANDRGQLGNATNANTGAANASPLAVGGGPYVVLAAGGNHGLGLRGDGALYAWGNNNNGQLGLGSTNGNANSAPTVVAGQYTLVAAGSQHSLGRRADGTLLTWGANGSSQLARPSSTPTQASTPTQEATGGTGWTNLASGSAAVSTLARTASGLVFASAGYNSAGQLGDGTTTTAPRLDRVSPLASFQPLPVQLVECRARRTGPAAVQLSWATATELHNEGFRAERSADGEQYETVGFVAGAGTSLGPQRYELTDPDAPTAFYYRLAQLDQDGTVRYSPAQYVAAGAPALALLPNPAHGQVQVVGLPTGATCTLYDALGRPVGQPTTVEEAGFSLQNLPAGVYVVKADLPGQPPQTARLVVY